MDRRPFDPRGPVRAYVCPVSTGGPRTDIRAVVLDTNALGRGQLDLGRVTALADRLSRHSIPLWIPTQVIWEWAAHAAEKVPEYRRARKVAGVLAATGLDGTELPPLPAWARGETKEVAAEIAAIFLGEVAAITNVVVLPPSGDSAIAAIRDQILGTGAGGKKQSVRTGASDSAQVRDVDDYASRVPGSGRIVFLSGDAKDLGRAIEEVGWPGASYTFVGSEAALFDLLAPAGSVLPPGSVAHLLTELFVSASPVALENQWSWLTANMDLSDLLATDEFERLDGHLERVTNIDLEGPSLIGIKEVVVDATDPDDDEEDVYATFTVVLLSGLAIDGYYIDNDGELQTDQIVVHDVVLEIPCVAQVGAGGGIVRVHESDSAALAPASEDAQWTDSDDALAWLIDYLSSFEGVTVSVDMPDQHETPFGTITVTGPRGTLEMELVVGWTDPSDGTSVEWAVESESRSLRIQCTYDPGSRVWLGREDSFDWKPPYDLTSTVGPIGYFEPFSGIGEIWRAVAGPDAQQPEVE